MQAGMYKEKVAVFVPQLSRNEFGEKVQTYEFLFMMWANVEYRSGARVVLNDEVINDYSKTFTARPYYTLNEKMLIEYDNKRWIITSIEKSKERNEMVIQTTLYND